MEDHHCWSQRASLPAILILLHTKQVWRLPHVHCDTTWVFVLEGQTFKHLTYIASSIAASFVIDFCGLYTGLPKK